MIHNIIIAMIINSMFNGDGWWICYKTDRGASMLHLIASSLLFMECLVTSGTQEWNGEESTSAVTRASYYDVGYFWISGFSMMFILHSY